MTQEEYQAVLDAITNSETEVDNQYKKVGNASTTLCDINNTINQITNMTTIRNKGGEVIGYDYIYTTPDIPDPSIIGVDSNTDSGWYATGGGGRSGGGGAGRGRRNTSYYSGSVNTDSQSTDKLNGNGLVSGFISGAFAGVSALSKFGKSMVNTAIDYMKDTIDTVTDTFGSLFVDKDGNDAVRVLYGIDSNGNVNMYMDEDTLGAFAIGLKDEGFFNEPDEAVITDNTHLYLLGNVNKSYHFITYSGRFEITTTYNRTTYYTLSSDSTIYIIWSGNQEVYVVSDSPLSYSPSTNAPRYSGNKIIKGSEEKCYYYQLYAYEGRPISYTNPSTVHNTPPDGIGSTSEYCADLLYICKYGVSGSGIPGVSNQPGATIPVDAITGADPHVVGQNLATQYPAVMGSPIQVVVMDDSCNEKTINYYAVPISYSPTNLNIEVPITGNGQLNPSFNPSIELPDIDMGNFMLQIINQLQGTGAGRGVVNTEPDPVTGTDVETPLPIEPPATGTGNTPIWNPDDVVGNSILWHVYNATPAQLNQFGYWLWVSGDIITQFKRIVSDPMDAILGLHKVYVTPNRGSATTIVCGNLDSEVSAFPVTNQYSEINCGDVWITEYFGNIYDYSPYTDISVYLPFIGIVPVSVDDVMRGKMSIHYTVDVYTGACIAEISINRDGVGGILYQFNGNCAVEYPITSMSYNNAIISAIGITSGAISAIPQMASGNVIGAGVSMAGSLLHSTMQQRENVQRSGSFSGNAGAMGAKIPYVIITRPQPEIAENYEDYEGYGANATVEIGNCSGYIKCRTVDLEVSGAYKTELDEIEALLKGGVYI